MKWYHILSMISWKDIAYDIIVFVFGIMMLPYVTTHWYHTYHFRQLLCAAAAAGSPRPGPGFFAVQHPRVSCPDPAFAHTLAPDSFSLSYGHHLGAASVETLPRLRSSLHQDGIVGCLLPPMKHGNKGANPRTFVTGQMQRQGSRWLQAEQYSMGTPACCMTL
jgi:hypothetical protein